MLTFSGQCRPALLFYLPGAILVAFFSLAKPFLPALPAQLPGKITPHLIDYTPLQNSWHSSWIQILRSQGCSGLISRQKSHFRLYERRYGRVRLKWADFAGSLILPEQRISEAPEKTLIKLVTAWQSLLTASVPGSTTIRWGCGGGRLWLRATVTVSPGALHGVKLNLARITLIQPLPRGDRTGFWPRKPPGLSPEPFTLPQPAPEPQAAEPVNLNTSPLSEAPVRDEITPPEGTPFPETGFRPKAAIIIDDLGYLPSVAEELLKVPASLTWAVLPKTPYAQADLAAAGTHGVEVILHLPLEPLDPTIDPGPGLIRKDWDVERIYNQLEEDLAAIPGAVGINNHMGSAGTRDERLMRLLMSFIGRRKLFFIDSKTVAGSVAEKYARRYRVPFAKRQVFIDNQDTFQSQTAALRSLLQIALKEGSAVGIAHARPGTARAIREMLPEFEAAGVELVSVSELVRVEE